MPHPFADLALARRLESAEGHSCAMFAEARGGSAEWMHLAGAYAVFDGADSPITQGFGLGVFDPVCPAEFDLLEQFFRERGAPVNLEVSPLAGVAFHQQLHGRGYRPIELSSVMFRPIAAAPVPQGRVHARPIAPGEENLWADLSARGWNMPELTPFLHDLGAIIARKTDSAAFLAELDGLPVATASFSFHAGVALMAGASTIPEARRQGAQLALLNARLAYAAALGCDLAMICAEPGSASQRNAERHGFRIAYTRTKWQLA
jgi:GNAT superfamily N-acetyltransferase